MSDINLSVGLNTGGAAKKADIVARSLDDLGDSTTDAKIQLADLTKKLSTLSGALNTFKAGNFVNVMKKIQQHSFNSASSVALLTAQLISAEAVLNRFRANLGAPIQPTAPAAPAAPAAGRQMSAQQAEKLATALDRMAVSGAKAAEGVQTLNKRVGGFVTILERYRNSLANIAAANAQVRSVAAGTVSAITAPTAAIEGSIASINRQLAALRNAQGAASGAAGGARGYRDSLNDVTRASNRAAGANRNHNAILSDQVGFWRFAGRAAALYITNLATDKLIAVNNELIALEQSLVAVAGSQEGAAESMEFLRRTADDLGFTILDLGKGYKQLAAATKGTELSGDATNAIFRTITESSRALGLSVADTEGTIRALSQMVSKGTVKCSRLIQKWIMKTILIAGNSR